MFLSVISLKNTLANVIIGHDGCSWEWPYISHLDAPDSTDDGARVLHPAGFRIRLRIHSESLWDQALWRLERQVSVIPLSLSLLLRGYISFITHPNVQSYPTYPEGFHGKSIPVDGVAVANFVYERLTGPVDADSPRQLFLSAAKLRAPMV